jgi:CheY-like chemotaxis protein
MPSQRGQTTHSMPQSVFIKVIGFTDVERHALNTVFRLSEARTINYSLWAPGAPLDPQLVLLDGQSYEARVEAESPPVRDARLVWIGEDAPPGVWRSFHRPLAWGEVVQAIDDVFAPQPDISFDLDLDAGPDTLPPDDLHPQVPERRALIACADINERLYLRAKLALHGITLADEAETAEQVQQLLRGHRYKFAVLDFGLPQGEGWQLVRQLGQLQPPIARLVVTKQQVTLAERIRARFAGARAVLRKPPDPEKLRVLMEEI